MGENFGGICLEYFKIVESVACEERTRGASVLLSEFQSEYIFFIPAFDQLVSLNGTNHFPNLLDGALAWRLCGLDNGSLTSSSRLKIPSPRSVSLF